MRIWIVLFFTISAIKLDFFSLKITKVKLRHKESFPPPAAISRKTVETLHCKRGSNAEMKSDRNGGESRGNGRMLT